MSALLYEAVVALAQRCDGASTQDGQGFNGTDAKYGKQLAATPVEAWGKDVEIQAYELLAKYAKQLAAIGISYADIPRPAGPKPAKRINALRAIDFRNGKIIVTIPYGDTANPKGPLAAYWNRDERGWVVNSSRYGKVQSWAEQNNVSISERAQEILDKAPKQLLDEYNGSVTLDHESLAIKFDYNAQVVEAIRTIPGRRFDKESSTWFAPKESITIVRAFATDHKFFMSDEVRAIPDVNVYVGPKILVHNKSFAISFTYDAELISQVRQMPGSEWSPELRVWLIPVECVEEVLRFYQQHDARLSSEARALINDAASVQDVIAASAAHDAEITIPGFGGAGIQLMPFQRAGVAYGMRALGYEYKDGAWVRTIAPTGGGILIGDEMGLGKAQVNGTRVLTPKGWTNIENLSIGDYVIGSNGHATKVTGVFPRGEMDIFTVGFNDGSTLDVAGDHLWAVQSVQNGHRKPDEWQVFDTNYLASNLHDGASNAKWKIPLVQPVHFEASEPLPIDPYLLGLLLGDGCIGGASVMFSSSDDFIVSELEKRIPDDLTVKGVGGYDYRIKSQHAGSPNALRRELDKLGLRAGSGEKFIPEMYLRTSPENRLALLRGLMDTDGHAGKDGTNEYVSISRELADGVTELVQSLGGVVRRSTKQPTKNGEPYGQLAYRVNVKLTDCPFLLPRKVDSWVKPTKYPPNRNIKSITPNGRGQVTCIAVDALDHLYVTEHYLVTHNTVQGLAMLKATEAFPAVIICPASLKLNWQREAEKWIKGVKVKVISGTSGVMPDADIYVVNYDILTHWVEKFPPINGIVLDESHYIKNGQAQRSKAAIRLSDKVPVEGTRVCLSGTPVVNMPLELMTQLRVIARLDDFGGAGKFRGEYGRSSSRALAMLNRKLRATCYVRRRKTDVLKDLPPKMWSELMIEGDPVVMKEYKKAEADIIKYLTELAMKLALESGADTEEARREAWQKALRARAAEHLVAISTLKQLAAKAKMKAAKEWIHDFLENDKKLVTFGWHTEVVNMVAENFADGCKIQGGVSMEKRQAAVDLFQNSDEQKVIACQIKAAGVGLTLTAASDVLFLEQGWTPADMDQAVDRCHRIGQQDSVTGWLMLTKDTIDEDIAALIGAKRVVVNQATDGTVTDDEEGGSMVGDLLVGLTERGMNQMIA